MIVSERTVFADSCRLFRHRWPRLLTILVDFQKAPTLMEVLMDLPAAVGGLN